MRMLFVIAAIGLLAPDVAGAAGFDADVLAPDQSNAHALDLLMGRPQAEVARMQAETQRLQMDLEDRRARRAMGCVLPDGRRVECR